MVSIGQESGYSLVGSSASRFLHSCNQQVSPGVGRRLLARSGLGYFISRLEWGQYLLPKSFDGYWQDSVPHKLLDWGPQLLGAVGQMPPSVPGYMGLSNTGISQESERMSEWVPARQKSILYHLCWEVTSYHFFPVFYLLEQLSRSSPHIRGTDYTGSGQQEVGTIGSHFRRHSRIALTRQMSLGHNDFLLIL